MNVMGRSLALGVAVLAVQLAFTTTGNALSPNKCLAGKNKCASKKAQGLLKCHGKAETTGTVLDPACTQKATDKFDGGADPAKGCFAKLEAKNDGPCVTFSDTITIENKIDAFVVDAVTLVDPGYPAAIQNKCSAGKKKCVQKKMAGILKCHALAVSKGLPVDTACLQKAKDTFDGGANPADGCFAKLEAKGGCLTSMDTVTLENKVDTFVQDVLCTLGYTTLACPTPTPTPSATPTATPVCPPGFAYNGALTATAGRFNYNLTLGLPGANSACNSNFPGSHACTLTELQCAQIAGSLVGATDISAAMVTSFWAIDPMAPGLSQCVDDAMGGSGLNWEYGTAHTPSRGQRVALNNGLGTLGPLQTGLQCNFSGNSNVGCCQ
jgi:hypothetical protein